VLLSTSERIPYKEPKSPGISRVYGSISVLSEFFVIITCDFQHVLLPKGNYVELNRKNGFEPGNLPGVLALNT